MAGESKVLKEIPIGGLKPDETVQANQEAQLLSQLQHPAILKFYASFVERDSFCIITEYCELPAESSRGDWHRDWHRHPREGQNQGLGCPPGHKKREQDALFPFWVVDKQQGEEVEGLIGCCQRSFLSTLLNPFFLSSSFLSLSLLLFSPPLLSSPPLVPCCPLPLTSRTVTCTDRDLHCKLAELRASGSWLSQAQVTEWLIQLLLGVHYMHQRRILHRDLKAKNIFLKKNIVKIGDFGVSCLLMGSCDLATTFTGTPYYMSPEALSHRGYNAKSDMWSLGCVVYEMCCLAHAFEGHNFLSVVMKIVDGETPTLPERYCAELNTLMQRMLAKDPVSRISATEALKSKYIEENMQVMKHKLSSVTLQDRTAGGKRHAAQILRALQRKVHLQTLKQRSEVQKMTPRERMRLRKLQAADEKARKLKQLAEEQYQENCLRMRELRWRHFQTVSVDVLTDTRDDEVVSPHHPAPPPDTHLPGPAEPVGAEISAQLCQPPKAESIIPEDPLTAEAYYYEDGFESCSEEDGDGATNKVDDDEEDRIKDEDVDVEYDVETEAYDTFHHTCGQDGDLEAMVWHMENILDTEPSVGGEEIQASPRGASHINTSMARSRIQRMREAPHSRGSQASGLELRAVSQRLGQEVFQRVYDYLREARRRKESEVVVKEALGRLVERPSDCFEVDQLLYYEEQLQEAEKGS
ncbi:hypothetical protein ACEWY4_020194 [Coilia grayii]|uniref:non-specific serine/threonine protein kinase n=1 Tax=Coilia grayii TaxID=363190 RepID=A0ABD1JD44_9TELE